MDWFSGIDANMVIGVVIGIIGTKAVKTLIITACPAAAPILAFFNTEQKQLAQVINRADGKLNKNEDLKQWAIDKGLKIAASLIK